MPPANNAAASAMPRLPYASGMLDVGQGHQLYWEQCGRPGALPMVFLHGGPGSGCSPRQRQFFEGIDCMAVLFDQRGCGRSLPRGGLQHNHTEALLHDIEALRLHLGIDQWLVLGGSWGAGLAVAYAAACPQACLGLVLRGVFLGRADDIDWFFQGAAQLLPDAWQQLALQLGSPATVELAAAAHTALAPQAASAPNGMLHKLHTGLHGASAERALLCATAWEAWEQSLEHQQPIAPRTLPLADPAARQLVDKYRLQSHYLVQQCFWGERHLLQRAQSLATAFRPLPVAILHGRQDWVCRPQAAWDLHQQLPGSRLQWVEGCGHNPFAPAMAEAQHNALQHFARHAREPHA